MSYGEPSAGAVESGPPGGGASSERLSLGVAARLSRYLQVLTQAKKMGKETISSQELSDYTHVNSTQIRRDLSGFGKFGKRGVGYNVEALVSQIRKILRTAGQHNIALIGAGHLGKAIASSEIFADHGFRVVSIFDNDDAKVGTLVGTQTVRNIADLRQVVEDEDIVVGVLAVPNQAAQGLADELVEAGREDHLQLLRVAAGRTPRGDRPHLEPGRRSALRAVLLSDLSLPGRRRSQPDPRTAREQPGSRPSRAIGSPPPRTSRSASRRSSRSSTRTRSTWSPRYEELRAAADARPAAPRRRRGRADLLGDRGHLGRRRRTSRGRSRASASGAGGCSRWRRTHDVALGATGTHPWADYREQPIIDTEHYRRVEEGLKYVAWRNNTFSLHVHVGVRESTGPCRSATGCGPCCPSCWRSRPTRPSWTAATAACTRPARRASPRASRAAGSPTHFGGWDAYRATSSSCSRPTRSSSSPRSGGRCARTSASARSRCGSATRRPSAGESDALAGLMVACIAQTMRDLDEEASLRGPRPAADRGEHVAGDPLRPRRAVSSTCERADGVPGARGDRRSWLAWTEPVAGRAGHRARVPRAQRRPAPAPR